MRLRGLAHLSASVAALALLAGCTAGPSDRPEIVVNDGAGPMLPPTETSNAVPVPPLDQPGPSSIRWIPCADNIQIRLAATPLPPWVTTQCARVNAPLDSPYAPGRGNVRLQVLKAGTGPVPLVVLNDLGGTPGTIYAARLAATLPQEFFAQFSLIGLDRRGTGNSEAPNCVPPEIRLEIASFDPTTANADDWIEPTKTAGQQCSIDLESRLPALDTWHTAADLDIVRQQLGLPRLNAIGHGEGSRVLSVFADRFPDRVGRMVLDGLPDVAPDVLQGLESVAAAAEATWQAFATDCQARSCELVPDPHQELPALISQLRENPLTGTEGLSVGPGVALRAVLAGLADRARWPSLSAAINNARHGDGGELAGMVSPLVLGSSEQLPLFDGELVISCNDTKARLTFQQVTQVVQDWNKKYPMFGALVAQRLVLCSAWPVATQPVSPPAAAGAPPIVVLATATDPVTPYDGTERAARAMSSAVLVSWQGGGHGALGLSGCATDAARAFLIDGQVPRDGTACPP